MHKALPKARRPACIIVAAVAFIAVATPPALAKTCSSDPIYASGEPASYEWLARIKTHANWRNKVRTLPSLGDPYANWKLAENTTERCFSGPEGTICQFSGIPCRRN